MKKAEIEKLCGGNERLKALCCGQGFCTARADMNLCGVEVCFTGKSDSAKREELERIASDCGAQVSPRVTRRTSYLVVCGIGSPGWLYGTFGKKIREASRIRTQGGRVRIVRETDFWRAAGEG